MTETIDAAKAPGVFSLDKFLAEVAYPEEEVTLFTDARSVNELMKLRTEYRDVEGKVAELSKDKRKGQRTVSGEQPIEATLKTELENRLVAIQTEIDALDDKVGESAITFKLRGMPQHVVEAITSKYFTDKNKNYSGTPEEEDRDYELMARSVIQVTDANGNIDHTEMTADRIKTIRGALLENEYVRLVQHVAHVNLNGALFEQATDASFLSRRSHLAWEQGLHNSDQGSA